MPQRPQKKDRPAPPAERHKRNRLRRTARWIVAIVITVAGLLLVAYFLRAVLVFPWLEKTAVAVLRSELALDLSVEAIQGSLIQDLDLRGVRITSTAPSDLALDASIPELRLRYHLLSLLQGVDTFLSSLAIDAADPDMRVDFSRPSAGPAEEASPASSGVLPASLPRLTISGGRLELVGDGYGSRFEGLAIVPLENTDEDLARWAVEAAVWRWHLPPLRDGEAQAEVMVALDPAGGLQIRDLMLDGALVVTTGQVDLSVLPAIVFSAHSPMPRGGLSVDGRVGDELLDLAVEAEAFDLALPARLLTTPGLEMTGEVSGAVDLQLPLARPEDLKGAVTLAGGPGQWRTFGWENITLNARAAEGTLVVQTVDIRRADSVLQVKELSLGTTPLLAGDWVSLLGGLNAVFKASLDDVPAVAAALGASPPPLEKDLPPHRLELTGQIRKGALTFEDSHLTAAQGTLRVQRLQADLTEILTQRAGAPFQAEASLDWPDLGRLSALLALPPMAGRLQGAVNLNGAWPALRGALRLSGDNLAWHDVPMGRLELACRSDGSWLKMETARLQQGNDQVTLSGRVALDSGRFEDVRLAAQIDDVALYAAAGPPDLPPLGGALRIDAALTGTVAAPQVTADVALKRPVVGALAATSAEGRFSTTPEGLRVEDMVIRSPHGRLTAAGRIDYPRDARPLTMALAQLSLEHGGADLGLQAPVQMAMQRDGRWQIPETVLAGSVGRLWIAGELGGTAPADLAVDLSAFTGDPWLAGLGGPVQTFDGLDARLKLSGTLSAPEVSLDGMVARLVLKDWPQALQGSFDITAGPEGIVLRRLQWYDDKAVRLTATGRLPLFFDGQWRQGGGPLGVEAELVLEDAALLAAIVPDLPLVRGAGEARVVLGGTLDAPGGSFRAEIRDVHLAPEIAQAAQGPFEIRAAGRIEADGVVLEALDIASAAMSLQGQGRWQQGHPLTAWLEPAGRRSSGTVTASADLRVPDLGWLAELSPGIRRTSGRLEGKLQVAGALPHPALTGRLVLSDGGLRPAGDAPPLQKIAAELTADAAGVTIQSCRGEVGGAPFNLSGGLQQEADRSWSVDLALTGDNLLLYRTAGLLVRADTALTLKGSLAQMTLQGDLGLTGGHLSRYVNFLGALRADRPSTGVPQEILFSLPDPPLKDLVFDVTITSREPFRLRNNVVNGSVRPDLHLGGTGLLPRLTGEIYVDPSRLRLPAGSMEITSGVVDFPAARANRPVLDLVGQGRLFDYDITALIEGPLEEPRVTLSSSPPLPGDQLMLMLLTGQPPNADGQDTAVGIPMNLAVYIGQDLLAQWLGSDTADSWSSVIDRFDVVYGRRVTRAGEETLEAQFRLGEDVLKDGDTIYLTGEKDVFDFYNAGLKFVFRFK